MRKLVTIAMTLALGAASSVALANDGHFFVNANAGASRYNTDNPFSGQANNSFSKTGKAGVLRAGYRWNSTVDYGVEAGYGFLGNATARVATDHGVERTQTQTRGWLLGGNLNYNINDYWYLDARAGWLRARSQREDRILSDFGNFHGRDAVTRTGEYFGVGGGYNVNKNLSVGLAYDTYRAALSNTSSNRIGMYSVQAEYRF